jgi:hypothetical protein
MGRTKEGLADLEEARRAKATDEHNVIDKAIAELGKDFTVFSIVRARFLHTSLSLTTFDSACGGDIQTTREENEEYQGQRLSRNGCSFHSPVTSRFATSDPIAYRYLSPPVTPETQL